MLTTAVINNVPEYGVARRFATLHPMESATLSVPVNQEGLTIAAVGENTATPTSDLSTGAVNFAAKEFAGGVRLSNSLLADSPVALADFCTGEFARAVAAMEDRAAFTADGTSTYGGITGILWRVENQAACAGAQYAAASGHDTFAEIDLADLTGMMAKLPEYARRNAKWWCSASVKDAVLTRLAAAAGGNNTQSIQGGIGASFLGYPIQTTPVMPADTAATYNGTSILAFGDLARSTAFGDRRSLEIAIDVSRYVEFRQTYVQLVSRFDMVNHMRGVTATACGPMVVLFGTT
jgi:HK97 family phage major capsid protein